MSFISGWGYGNNDDTSSGSPYNDRNDYRMNSCEYLLKFHFSELTSSVYSNYLPTQTEQNVNHFYFIHIIGDNEAKKLWSRQYEKGWEPKI
jgi:hypothetical protein